MYMKEAVMQEVAKILSGSLREEPIASKLFLPSDFEDEGGYMSVFHEVGKHKLVYGSVAEFWAHALYGFLESVSRLEMFEKMAEEAGCKETTQQEMIDALKGKIDQLKVKQDLDLEGEKVYRMIETEDIISYAGETSDSFFAVFWCCSE
jgi:hypothetical protein